MKNTGPAIFKITRIITVICILVAAYAIIDGSFFRGFGDDEFIMALIFYAVFLPSLLYTVGYFIYTKLPDADETGTDPPWFKRLCIGATTYPLIIAAFGVFNAVTGIVEFFGKSEPLGNMIFGLAVALAIMLIVPIIPRANTIIIIYFYRKNRRKKYKDQRGG